MIGISPPMVRRTPSITRREASGSQAKTIPRFSTLGQEILTSSALIPETDRTFRARVAYSSTVSPAMETITRDFCSTSHGTSFARKASIPGPCNPIELSMPDGVSAIRGVGLPYRGLFITDFVTTAPISRSAKNCDNSLPELAHPLAVKMGVLKKALPKVVEKSKLLMAIPLALGQPSATALERHPLPVHQCTSATSRSCHLRL